MIFLELNSEDSIFWAQKFCNGVFTESSLFFLLYCLHFVHIAKFVDYAVSLMRSPHITVYYFLSLLTSSNSETTW